MSGGTKSAPASPGHVEGETFDAVYLKFWPRLMQHALRVHGLRDAEEIAQETLARGLHRLDLTRSEGEMWVWLSRVSRNVAADLVRRRRLCDADGSSLEQPESREAFLPEVSALLAERRSLVKAAMAGLSDAQRQMMIQHDLEGLTCREIAEFHGLSEHCVRKSLQRVRAKLARQLRVLRDPAALLVPWPLIHTLSRRLRPARGGILAAGMAGAALMSTLVFVNPDSAQITETTAYDSSVTAADDSIQTSGTPLTAGRQDRVSVPRAAQAKRSGAPAKLVSVPKTPLSPGQKTYIVIEVPTPVGTVHAEEELAAGPSGGLLCNSPVADCR